MAFVINNFFGGETLTLDEFAAVAGGPSGASGYLSLFQDDYATFGPFLAGVSDAGPGTIIGLRIKPSTLYSTGTHQILGWTNGADNDFSLVFRDADGTVDLLDANGAVAIGGSIDIDTDGQWHYIEVYVERGNSPRPAALFIDGTSEGSITDGDFHGGTSLVRFGSTVLNQAFDIDDVYVGTGATSASDRLGECEVIRYRTTIANATPDTGDDLNTQQSGSPLWNKLDEGDWGNTVNWAGYSGGLLAGSVLTDDIGGVPSGGGPNGDTTITGQIVAAKYMFKLRRGNGSGTTHHALYGNSGDGTTESADLALTPSFVYYSFVSESTTVVPSTTEYLKHGFKKSSGGRDIECERMAACVLHVPAAGSSTFLSMDGVVEADIASISGLTFSNVSNISGLPI